MNAIARILLGTVGCAAILSAASNLPVSAQIYATSGDRITVGGQPWCAGGANSFDQWGQNTPPAGDNVKVVREALDDFSQISSILAPGTSIGAPGGGTLHSLQDMVADNRAAGEITVLCPFNWDGTGNTTFSGADPTGQSYFSAYLTQLGDMAKQFAGQSDVWIDPWNEPNFSSDTDWTTYCTDIYNTIRNAGNAGLILIPGDNYDADPSVFVRQTGFLSGRTNIVANIHAYADWCEWAGTPDDQAPDINGIDATRLAGWPVIVGEVGPQSNSGLTDADFNAAKPFLDTTVAMSVPTLAWSWDSNDGLALSSGTGLTYWGQTFVSYLAQYAPGDGDGMVAEDQGTYEIENDTSSLCLDDPSGGAAGTGTDQQSYSGADQQWLLTPQPFGYFEIASAANGLALTGANTQKQTDLEPYSGAPDQLWGIVAYGTYDEIVDQANGNVLNDYGSGKSVGNDVGLWYGMTGNTDELWTMIPVAVPPAAPASLTATAGNGKVSLRWIASTGAKSYSVYRGLASGQEGTSPLASGISATTYSDASVVNGTKYYYIVRAVNGAGPSPPSNQAAARPTAGGLLLGAKSVSSTSGYNLTALGTIDWAYWNGTYIHKASGGGAIGNANPVGPAGAIYGVWSLNGVKVSWSDGTPIATGTDDHAYVNCKGAAGDGWSITVPADKTLRTLQIWSGGSTNSSALQFTAHLSDGSAPDYVLDQTTTTSAHIWLHTVTYHAASNNQTLTITVTKNDNNANTSVVLIAAWLK